MAPAADKGRSVRTLSGSDSPRIAKAHSDLHGEQKSTVPQGMRGYRPWRLGALTATRKQEFVYADAAEFDAATSTWTIPPARRKDCKPLPFRIPLSTQANMIIESVLTTGRLFTNSPYRPCVNTWGVSEKFKRLRGDKTFTIHGMRSTFSTWCAETGIDWVLREKCLMHATENAVGASYQRSDLLDQRREVMQAWADALISVDELSLFLQRLSK